MRLLTIRLFQIAAIGFGLPGTLGTLYFGGLALYSRWSAVQTSGGQKDAQFHLFCLQSDSFKCWSEVYQAFEKPLSCGHGSVESLRYRAVTARERFFNNRALGSDACPTMTRTRIR